MQVLIQFTASGASSALGGFAPGDRARCSAEHARHLVEQVGCARYVQEEPDKAGQPAAVAPKPRRARKAAEQ